MGVRQLLPPIAADKGEGNAARGERVGDASDWLARKMSIEQRAVHVFLLDRLQRIAHRAGRTDHGDAFAWLHGEFTRVRRSDPGATW